MSNIHTRIKDRLSSVYQTKWENGSETFQLLSYEGTVDPFGQFYPKTKTTTSTPFKALIKEKKHSEENLNLAELFLVIQITKEELETIPEITVDRELSYAGDIYTIRTISDFINVYSTINVRELTLRMKS